jgi:hypothetical protein
MALPDNIIIFISTFFYHVWLELNKTERKIRHHTDEYYFAHFSEITSTNYREYPDYLMKTTPIYITLKAGDSLYIPSKWWHHIKSYRCVAVNYWMVGKKNAISQTPKVYRSHFQDPDFIEKIYSYNGKLETWNSMTDSIEVNSSNILNQLKDNNYIVTLPGYVSMENKMNIPFYNYIIPYIKNPPFLENETIDKNVWIATGYHDTGLHYDDYDGILSVIMGEKKIILYPPADTMYLAPYNILPFWAESKPVKISYNIYRYINTLDSNSLPSSRLLYESIKSMDNKLVLQAVSDTIRDLQKLNHIVYGCKWHNGVMRWELYYYHYNMKNSSEPSGLRFSGFNNYEKNKWIKEECKNNSMIIHSFDLYNKSQPEEVYGDNMHYYYNLNTNKNFPFCGYGDMRHIDSDECDIKMESMFILNDRNHFLENKVKYLEILKFQNIKNFGKIDKLLSKYICNYICVHNKMDQDNIFIQYLGITIDDFIDFLEEFKYPIDFMNHVKENKEKYRHIVHEITIVYNIETLQPIRTAFYGIV